LRTASWSDDASLRETVRRLGSDPARTWIVAHSHIPGGEGWAGVSVVPRDAEAFARALYAELHRCDACGVELIVVESPPDSPEWQGIADRLRRAETT
jgi:L-threonylcarbamoyladenylate synthase